MLNQCLRVVEVLVRHVSQLVIACRCGDTQNPNCWATRRIVTESTALDVVPAVFGSTPHMLSKEDNLTEKQRTVVAAS